MRIGWATPFNKQSAVGRHALEVVLEMRRRGVDVEIIRTEPNGKVRLRLINGATSSAFWINLGDVEATVLAVDGNDVEPITGSRIAPPCTCPHSIREMRFATPQ